MRTFSRWMPTAPIRKAPFWAGLILGCVFLGLLYYLCNHPYWIVALVVFAAISWRATVKHNQTLRKQAQLREEESICTFVRSFDYRSSDTWILRAAYEEISQYLKIDSRTLPIRADDRFEEELDMDSDDLEDVAVAIANRTGRSLHNSKENPFYAKIKTVRDLVTFFEHQARLSKAASISATTPEDASSDLTA